MKRLHGKITADLLVAAFRNVMLPALFFLSFLLVSYVALTVPSATKLILIDPHIYVRAAGAWLAGGDPWSQSYADVYFAAPPPTLIPYALVAPLPEAIAVAIIGAVGVAAGVAAVRLLRIEWWWLFWPPLVNAFLVGNPDAWLPALLAAGAAPAGLAALVKVYAVVPAVAVWGIRAAGVAGAGLLVTAPFLPWGLFLQDLDRIVGYLADQSHGGLSSFTTIPIAVVAIAALVVLDPRDAAFLFVPALWPNTQFHYSAIALAYAARSPIVAFGLAIPWPYAATVVAVAEAALAVWRRRAAGMTGPRMFIGVLASPPRRGFGSRPDGQGEARVSR